MAFKIADHQNKTFFIDIESGGQTYSYELMALSYMKWNELGLLVPDETAPKIKDPKDPKKYIDDLAGQRKLDAECEWKRNAIRVVYALENGEGIDWNGDEPETLEDKANTLQQLDAVIFFGLINGLRTRTFGGVVSSEDAATRFQRVQAESVTSDAESQAND
jgi:hypothetical protein